jgi:hypothetical protein
MDENLAVGSIEPDTEYKIRSVIEAYSHAGVLEGAQGEHACGPVLSKGDKWEARIRVTVDGATAVYDLDRWD